MRRFLRRPMAWRSTRFSFRALSHTTKTSCAVPSNIVLTIERALSGQIRLQDVIAARTQAAGEDRNVFRIPPEVSIDNSLSNRLTVLEVTGLDRPGLLYELTAILSWLNLNIASAHIVTFGEKAADVFYVTDLMPERKSPRRKSKRRSGGRFCAIFDPAKEAPSSKGRRILTRFRTHLARTCPSYVQREASNRLERR